MLNRWLNAILFVSFALVTLMVAEMTRRPLCIESKVVEKIDRLSVGASPGSIKSETIYRCAFNKATPFSEFFNAQVKDLSVRVQRIERLLESIEPFHQRARLTVVTDQPYHFEVHGHNIMIGEALLLAPGHLEKAVAKVWYQERRDAFFIHEPLMEEVVTDLLVFLQDGDLDIGDPISHFKTSLQKAKWPYVLKSVAAYCDSPWKLSEHYQTCADNNFDNISENVLQLSLRPLLVSSWVAALKSLPLKDQVTFVRSLGGLLKEEHVPELPIVQRMKTMIEYAPLLMAGEAVKNINLFVSTSVLLQKSEAHRLFVSAISQELRKAGFQDVFAEASFDILFMSGRTLTEDSVVVKHFMKLAKERPHMHIALRDREHVWMLPSKFPIPVKSFGQMRANRAVVEKCGGFDFNFVMGYAQFSEKLLILENCDSKKELNFARYLKDGAEGFGAQNKDISFIQFHLPSLMMKSAELTEVSNVFDLIRNREVESRIFQTLGWQEIKWSEQAAAYHPKANIDAIEWFRTN